MRKLWRFHGGVKLPGNKALSLQSPLQTAAIPAQLVIPLQQHIGAPAHPIVDVGDRVLTGQMIAQAEGFISAPVHASSSGTVVAIEERPIAHPSGMPGLCIVIQTDGKDEWIEHRSLKADYQRMNPSELRNRIRDAGIVGLGGAGFPAFIKLNPGPNKIIDTLILNGAECEPYITCDQILMQERAREILDGLLIMRHALQAKQCLIGIEDNKPQSIAAMRDALTAQEQTFIDIVTVPTRYPAGGERQLIMTLTGREVPSHGLPVHIGVVCHNVATALAVGKAINLGEPLISRVITLTGQALRRPCNVEARIGTPMQSLLEFAQLENGKLDRLLMGGPMMGFAVQDTSAPAIKTTNCLLAAARGELPAPVQALPCIRCGECVRVCPAQLLPQQLYWYTRARDFDKLQQFNLFDCIECACCSYVCPSHIPLEQYYRFAKTEIHAQERDRQKSDIARERHEFHKLRLERRKLEDEERKRKKRELLEQSAQQDDSKQAAIQAALDRVKAKKAAQQTGEDNNA